MGKIHDIAIKVILDSLEKDAKRILNECVNERTYEHQTYNLYDSYGYGIYYKGRLIRSGFLSPAPTATENKKWYGKSIQGRDAIKEFLSSGYSASGMIDLAIAAAMPYARVLEEGGGGIKKKYKVISMSFGKLNEIKGKYMAKVKIIK